MLQVYVPSGILGLYLWGCFYIEIDDVANRMANLSVVLLTYVSMMGSLRVSYVANITVGEVFMLFYLVLSLLPILYIITNIIYVNNPYKRDKLAR